MRGGAAKDDFGNVFFANKLGDRGSHVGALKAHDLRAHVLREAQIAFQALLVGFALVAARIHVHDEELRAKALRHAGSTGDKILSRRIGTDADGDPLANGNAALFALLVAKGFKVVVDRLRDMPQR